MLLTAFDETLSTEEFSKNVIHSDQRIKLVRLILPTGKQIPAHQAPGVLTVYCIKGNVDFVVGSETHALVAGKIIYVPDQQTHSLLANEGSILLVTIFLQQHEVSEANKEPRTK